MCKGKSLWTVLLLLSACAFLSLDGDQLRGHRKTEKCGCENRHGRNPGNHWAISFGERSGANDASSILNTDDRGFLITGHLSYRNGQDGWVYKFSENGDLEWANKVGWLCRSSSKTKDGGYILAGRPVIKLNRSGQVEWLRLQKNVDDLYFHSIQQTEDGGSILIGKIWWPDPLELNAAECLLKIDENGEVEWAKKFGTRHGGYNSIQRTPDGGYLVIGNYESDTHYFWIMKLSSLGEIVWQEKLGIEKREFVSCLTLTSDGGFILAGESPSFGARGWDILILKFQPDGLIEWQKTYGGPGDERWGQIAQTRGGGYIVSATTKNNNSDDCLIFKLSAQGRVGWVRTFGGQDDAYQSYEDAAGVCQAADGGFAVIGSTDDPSAESPGLGWPQRNILFIKLSGNGNIGGCGFLRRAELSAGNTSIVPRPLDYIMTPIDLRLEKINWSPSPSIARFGFLCDELNEAPDARPED